MNLTEQHIIKRPNPFWREIDNAYFLSKNLYNYANYIIREESYTSKCSFLDNEPLRHQEEYLGKRVKRGLFRSKENIFINSDINASYNIMRKYFEKENVYLNFIKNEIGLDGFVVNPVIRNCE